MSPEFELYRLAILLWIKLPTDHLEYHPTYSNVHYQITVLNMGTCYSFIYSYFSSWHLLWYRTCKWDTVHCVELNRFVIGSIGILNVMNHNRQNCPLCKTSVIHFIWALGQNLILAKDETCKCQKSRGRRNLNGRGKDFVVDNCQIDIEMQCIKDI